MSVWGEDKVQDGPDILCTKKYGRTQRIMGTCQKEASLTELPLDKLDATGASKQMIVTDLVHLIKQEIMSLYIHK